MDMPPNNIEDPSYVIERLWYFASVLLLGSIAAISSLLGSRDNISVRAVWTYALSGGLVSLGLTLLLAESYGFSFFLMGVAIFAGYKAVDVLTGVSALITDFIRKFFEVMSGFRGNNNQGPQNQPQEPQHTAPVHIPPPPTRPVPTRRDVPAEEEIAGGVKEEDIIIVDDDDDGRPRGDEKEGGSI
jgi:hypothetical protein